MDRFRDTISLKEATQYCDYSQEYLNLLIRKGKLKGVKMGRNWVTTRAWLNDYVVEHGHGSDNSEGRSSAENSKKPGSSFFQILNKPLSVSSKVIKKITAASAIACLAVMLLFGFIGAAGSFDYQKFSGNISADKIGADILAKAGLVGGGIESVSEGIAFGGSNFKSACGKINISTLRFFDGASDAAVSFETKIEAGESALGRRGRFEALALGGGISRFGASLGGGAKSMGEGRRAAVQEVLPEIAGNLSRSGNSAAGYFADVAYGRAKIGNEQLSFAAFGAATVFQNPKEFFSAGNLSRLSLGAKESILTGIGAFVDASSGGIKNGFAVQGRMMNSVSKAMNEGGQVAVFEVMPEMGRGSIGILADAGNLSFDVTNLISVLGRDIGFNARDYAVDSAVTKKRFAEDRIAAYVSFNKKTTVAVGSAARSSLAALSGLAAEMDERMEYGGRSVARGFSISADVANKAAGSGANYVQNNTTAGKASVFSFFKAIENKLRDIARSWLGITDPRLAKENGCNTANCAAPAGGTPQAVGAGISKSGNNQPADTGNIGSNSGNVTVVNNSNNYYQPVKEVLSTNTLVQVDQETKDRVNLILEQLDSDRPNFSLGQTFNLPSNLKGNTININSGHFTVDKYGNIATLGDVEITGNFTVTGAQTFSGAAALSASTDVPLFVIDQAGAGSALRADNIALKGSTISTVSSDTSLLINPNGSGAVQFHTADNFIDSTGSLVLNGDITLTSGGTFYTTDNGNLVFAPNGTGNLVVGETGNTAKIVPFEGSTLGYDLGSATSRWYDIYAKGKLDVDGTTLINNNLSFSSGTNLNSNQLSFINEGLITTGASKDITLQAGAGGKTIITSGTSTIEVADGAEALYAVSGVTSAKLADGTYALDATGDVRVVGNLSVSGGVLFVSAAGERIDTTTDHLLKLTTSGDAKVVLGDAAGAYQFQVADSAGNIVSTINSDGQAVVIGITSSGNISPSTDLTTDLGDATHRFNNIYVGTVNATGMANAGQAVFTYQPLTTNFADSSVLVNPTTAIANAPLLGVGVNGTRKFSVDAEGDAYFAGNVGIGTTAPVATLNLKENEFIALTGTVAISQGGYTVTGTGTLFTSELADEDLIKIGDEIFAVQNVVDDTHLYIPGRYLGTTVSGIIAYKNSTDLIAADDPDGNRLFTVSSGGALSTKYQGSFGSRNNKGNVNLYFWRKDNSSSGLNVYKRGNTSDIDGAVLANGELGYHNFYGWDGSAYGRGALAIASASEDWGTTAHGTDYKIGVVANGTTAAFYAFTVKNSGNVGIGTTSPLSNLAVAQGTVGTGTVSTPGSSTTLTGVGTQFTNTFKVGDTLTVAGETIRTIGTITSDTVLDVTVAFSATPRAAVAYTLTGGTRFSVLGNGNVGIGTTSPASTLEVNSTASASIAKFSNPSATSGGFLSIYTNSTQRGIFGGGGTAILTGSAVTDFVVRSEGQLLFATNGNNLQVTIDTSGNVGIGATVPASKLTVRSDSTGAVVEMLRLENLGTAAAATGSKIAFALNKDGGVVANFGEIVGLTTSTDVTNYSGSMQFKLASNGSLDTLAEFGNPNISFNRPLEVNVAGDTGISYDLQFMSTGTSHLTSAGPLVISAGDINNGENLTLTTQSNEAAGDFGTASAGGAATLTDSTKAWVVDEWIDGTVTIIAGSGKGQTQTITDSDATSITVADWDTALADPAANSVYRLSYAPGGDVLVNVINANSVFGGFKVLGNGNGGYAFRIAPDGSAYVGGEGAGGANLFVKQNITAYGSILTLKQLTISEAGTPVATSAVAGGSCADSTAYYYKVTAINDNGETTGTAQFTVTTGASGSNINLNTVAWSTVTGATGYKIYRSTENNDWDGDANESWVDGRVVAAPTITYDDNCAGDTGSLTPPVANTTGGKLAINTASPTRRLEVLENTSAIPQMKLVSDSSNYFESYVDSTGNLSMKLTGSAGDSFIILDENLKVCSGGDFGSVSCPTTGFSIAGTGNMIVENKVVADSFERICPTGYIWVPGNAKYGTMPGFCVMKYEAKNVSSVATSQADLAPWATVSQESSRAYCQALGLGYHLISEGEWMTIASNIADTPINDLNDGAAYPQLATGHSANTPPNALASLAGADPVTTGCNLSLSLKNAANAYTSTCQVRGDGGYGGDAADSGFYGTEQAWTGVYTSGADNDAQLRTHILSNGNVIWDLSGNVWEWVDALINEKDNPTDGTEVGDGVAEWEQWNTTYNLKGSLSNSRPPDDGWSSTNGIGQVYTWGQDETGTTLYAFLRGGNWLDGSSGGVFAVALNAVPTLTGSGIGFRCAR